MIAIAPLVMAFGLAQAATSAGEDPRVRFGAACRRVTEAGSYTVAIQGLTAGLPGREVEPPRAPPETDEKKADELPPAAALPPVPPPPPEPADSGGPPFRSVTLLREVGQPLELRIDVGTAEDPSPAIRAWKLGDRVVVKNRQGEFQVAGAARRESGPPVGEDSGAGGQTGAESKPDGAESGSGGGRRRSLGLGGNPGRVVALAASFAPHVLLAGIEGKIESVKEREDRDAASDGVEFDAVLTRAAARSLIVALPRVPGTPPERVDPPAGAVDDRVEPNVEATLTLKLDPSGVPVAIVLVRRMKTTQGGATQEREGTTTFALSQLGATKVDVPPEAMKLFEP